jgi:hypothetical protein
VDTAIAAMVIKQAAEVCKKLESDLIELAASGFEHSIHDALEECAARISALTPADAEAELEALTKSAKRYQILHEHFKFADDSAQEIRFDASITPERSDKPEELDEAIVRAAAEIGKAKH